MSVSNKSIFLFFRWLLLLLVFLIAADFALASVEGMLSDYFENHYLALGCLVIILILIFVRVNYFSYEDEYEIIHIRSKSLIFGDLGGAGASYEFPKGILYDYDYKKGLLNKKLTIYLRTTGGVRKIRSFSMMFVSRDKIKYVLKSLKKVSERNRKNEDASL